MIPVHHLAEYGYTLIPWKRNHAATYISGFTLDSITTTKEIISKWMVEFPDADWAIVPRGIVVLDLECKHGLDGIQDLDKLCRTNGINYADLVANQPRTITRNKGRHIYFRAPDNCTIKGQCHIREGIEVKHLNGQVHIPPSQGYEWERPLCPMSEIGVLPDFIYAEWKQVRAQASENPEDAYERLTAGNRHIGLAYFASKLRSIGLSQAEIFDSLKSIRNTRCNDLGDFDEIELQRIAKHFSRKPIGQDIIQLALDGDKSASSVVKYIIDRVVATSPTQHTEKLVDAIEGFPDGFDGMPIDLPIMHKWVSWATTKAIKPQPRLQCMSFLTAISVVAGRKYAYRGARPNLYTLGLADSGQGKEWIINSTRRLLIECGFKDMIGAHKFNTHNETVQELKAKPSIIWLQDEVADWFKVLTSLSCPVYVRQSVQLLLQIYSSYRYEESGTGTRERMEIPNVYGSWYATAQPETFKAAMTFEMLHNGFFNRMLYVNADFALEDPDRQADEHAPIPQDIIDMVSSFMSEADSIVMRRAHTSLVNDTVIVDIPETDEANEYRKKLIIAGNEIVKIAIQTSNVAARILMQRRTLHVYKIAALWAIIENPTNPRVTKRALEWAASVVDSSLKIVYLLLRRKTASTSNNAGTLIGDMLDYIEAAAERGRTKTEISRKFRQPARLLNEIFESLIVSNDIVVKEIGEGIRHSQLAVATKYAPQDGVIEARQ